MTYSSNTRPGTDVFVEKVCLIRWYESDSAISANDIYAGKLETNTGRELSFEEKNL